MECPYTLTLRSTLADQPLLEQFVDQVCEQFNIGNTYFGHIMLALTEAFENAVIHGNKLQEDRIVTIRLINTKRGLKFSVSDEGEGFNPGLVPDPTNPDTDENTISGRGLFTIATLADEFSFGDNGSTLHISFYVSSINRELSELRAKELHKYVSNIEFKQTNLS